MELRTNNITLATKKVIAYAYTEIRTARGGYNPPMIVTMPKDLLKNQE
ncbi:MAG: hypothetical protein AB7F53_03200 [Nitrososphaeraceae archaeon]